MIDPTNTIERAAISKYPKIAIATTGLVTVKRHEVRAKTVRFVCRVASWVSYAALVAFAPDIARVLGVPGVIVWIIGGEVVLAVAL